MLDRLFLIKIRAQCVQFDETDRTDGGKLQHQEIGGGYAVASSMPDCTASNLSFPFFCWLQPLESF